MADDRERLPEPAERIHLPGPAYTPVVTAAGVTIALVGVVVSWVMFAAGVLIALVAIVRWVSQMRREMSELPLEH